MTDYKSYQLEFERLHLEYDAVMESEIQKGRGKDDCDQAALLKMKEIVRKQIEACKGQEHHYYYHPTLLLSS